MAFGPTADGIVPDSHFVGTRFTFFHPAVGDVPLFSIDERPDPTRKGVAQDGSSRSAGDVEAQSINLSVPMGNDQARQAMHAAIDAGRGNISAGYKADGILTVYAVDGSVAQTETLAGCWFSGRTRPAFDKSPAGSNDALSEQFEISYDSLDVRFV